MHTPQRLKFQRKTRFKGRPNDIGLQIKWFCRRTERRALQSGFRRTTFNLVKAFHKNNVFLQYQIDECHKLLTNKVDLRSGISADKVTKNKKIALSIFQAQSARLPNFALKELFHRLVGVNANMTSMAVYGITHWWFSRRNYISTNHSIPGWEAVRSQMRILSEIVSKCLKIWIQHLRR
ncbi:hypothetical protein Tco_1217139 [Tanacetum coccineum]